MCSRAMAELESAPLCVRLLYEGIWEHFVSFFSYILGECNKFCIFGELY